MEGSGGREGVLCELSSIFVCLVASYPHTVSLLFSRSYHPHDHSFDSLGNFALEPFRIVSEGSRSPGGVFRHSSKNLQHIVSRNICPCPRCINLVLVWPWGPATHPNPLSTRLNFAASQLLYRYRPPSLSPVLPTFLPYYSLRPKKS